MSVFDVLSSAGWALSTLPIPKYDKFGEPSIAYGAQSNSATCTAQGFLVQLGYSGTSVRSAVVAKPVTLFLYVEFDSLHQPTSGLWYNMSLSIYYLLLIRFSWRPDRIRRNVKWLHAPVVIGLIYGK